MEHSENLQLGTKPFGGCKLLRWHVPDGQSSKYRSFLLPHSVAPRWEISQRVLLPTYLVRYIALMVMRTGHPFLVAYSSCIWHYRESIQYGHRCSEDARHP